MTALDRFFGVDPARRSLTGGSPTTAERFQAATLAMAVGMALLTALAIAVVGQPLPILLLMAAGAGLAVLMRPDLATPIFLFGLYMNLPVIATQFHGVPPLIGAAFAMILLLPFGYHLVLRREAVVATPALFFVLAYLGAQLLSTVFSVDVESSVNEIGVFLVEGLVLYVLVSNVLRTPAAIRQAVWVLLIAGALMGSISVWQEFTGSYSNDLGGLAQINSAGFNVGTTEKVLRPRLAGPVGEQNRYAQILIVLVPLGFFRILGERRPSLRATAAVLTLLITAGLLLTFSRGAFVALVGLTVLAAAMRYVRIRDIAIALVVGVAAMGVIAPSFITRIDSLVGVAEFFGDTTPDPDGAILGRLTSNLAALNAFTDHPIVGVGPGQYSRALSNQYANELDLRHFTGTRRAHNLYLETAADLGVIGLSAFLGIAAATLLGLWRVRRRWLGKRPLLADLATSMWFSVIAYLATAVFLHLSYERYLWVLLALAAATVWTLGQDDPGEIEPGEIEAAETPEPAPGSSSRSVTPALGR
jgi:putative inorganic carbon (HCO3(-)) transporter